MGLEVLRMTDSPSFNGPVAVAVRSAARLLSSTARAGHDREGAAPGLAER